VFDDLIVNEYAAVSGMKNPKYSELTLSNAALFTTNPTLPDMRLNLGLRRGKQREQCVTVLPIITSILIVVAKIEIPV
jgi:hypothetical protein